MKPCPKCGYVRKATDSHVMAGLCPACGIAIAKYRPEEESKTDEPPDIKVSEPKEPFFKRLIELLGYVPEKVDPISYWGRAIVFVGLFIWGWSFILGGIDWQSINGSFMHNINLPFHEFGHVLFSFMGRFMGILGGSLFQVLLPLGITVAFVVQRRDNFGGSVTLWWAGQNFIDISPYIADAPTRSMPLIMGMGESAHDWGNLLIMTNSLDSAGAIAGTSFALGSLLIIISQLWGGRLLYKQWERME